MVSESLSPPSLCPSNLLSVCSSVPLSLFPAVSHLTCLDFSLTLFLSSTNHRHNVGVGRGLVPTSSLHARFYLTPHSTTNPCMFKMAVTGMFGRHAHELHSAEASDDRQRQPEEWKSLADAQASAKRAVDRVLDVVRMHVYHFALFKLIYYNSIECICMFMNLICSN